MSTLPACLQPAILALLKHSANNHHLLKFIPFSYNHELYQDKIVFTQIVFLKKSWSNTVKTMPTRDTYSFWILAQWAVPQGRGNVPRITTDVQFTAVNITKGTQSKYGDYTEE